MSSAPLPEAARQNIQAVRDLEAEYESRRTRIDRMADTISQFVGSFSFLICQTIVIVAWIGANVALGEAKALDPFPFDFLTLLLDIEVILLTTFVLMTQDRQSRETEKRGHIQLQVALLAEQEATKMLEMLRAICARMGLNDVANDPELARMLAATHVSELARELDKPRSESPSPTPPADPGAAPSAPPPA